MHVLQTFGVAISALAHAIIMILRCAQSACGTTRFRKHSLMGDQTVRAATQSNVVRMRTGITRAYKTSDHRWRKLAAEFKAYHRPRKSLCWLCLTPIDYELRTGPWCFETDHYHPRATHPHLMFVWSNLRPSHRRCNRARQAKVVAPQQDWVVPAW